MKNPIRITKRAEMPFGRKIVIEVSAVILSIVFAGLVMLLFGLDPIKIFASIIEGAFGTERRVIQMINKVIPLTIASLGLLIAFKMKFWNIGGEGQIVMGAFAATFVALNAGNLPKPIMLLLMALASIVVGAFWALIPAGFKAKWNTNETIFTLMMNYVAIKFVTYLQYGPWRDPSSVGFPRIPNIGDNARMPMIGKLQIGIIIAIVLVVLVYIYINHTKKGYEITVVGESIETARYAGMNIPSVIISSMAISGGLCGLVGMVQVSAIEGTLVYGIGNNYGFTAIITAWLARLNPIATFFVCIAFAVLLQGAAYIQLAMDVPSSVAQVVQGLILFFVLGSEFFLRYKVNFDFGKSTKHEEVNA
jgi:simple sugar transport system permease protein